MILAAYAAGKVTEAALDKVGESFVARRLSSTRSKACKDFDTGMTFPVSYSKDNHEGSTLVEIIRVRPDLKWESVAQSSAVTV